jgi:hypothetical protein
LRLISIVAVCGAAAAPAWAQQAAELPSRPRIELAVGMGASVDGGGPTKAPAVAVPSFFVMGGFGSGTLGFDLTVFANSANGRYREPDFIPVDRLGLQGIVVVRLAAEARPDDQRYRMRVARTLAIDLGVGVERASRLARVPETVNRLGTLIGLHADIPLTPSTSANASELRLRLAVRRFFGASQVAFPDGEVVSNTSGELFAALAAVF